VGAGLVDISVVTFAVIFAGLVGAIVWDLITWYYGLPTSSSHALIGGYAGAAVAKAGWSAIIFSGWTKTLIFIVLAPLIGLSLGFLLMVVILWIFSGTAPGKVDGWFRRLQLLSAAAYSLGHGGNDAQKTMGIIAGALVAGGYLNLIDGKLPIPLWVIPLRTRRSRLAHCQGAQRSFTRWDPRSPVPACRRVRRGDRGAISLSRPPTLASRSAPPTPSLAQSSASDRSGVCPPSAGASPAASFRAWVLTIPARRSFLRSRIDHGDVGSSITDCRLAIGDW
jgi:hypothetical protein